jgi:hypothetical protein
VTGVAAVPIVIVIFAAATALSPCQRSPGHGCSRSPAVRSGA